MGDFHTDPLETSLWLTIANAKGGKRREIKVPPTLWQLYSQLSSAIAGKGDPAPELLMFPLSSRQVERIIKTAGEASSIEKKLTPHWLRHQCHTCVAAGRLTTAGAGIAGAFPHQYYSAVSPYRAANSKGCP